MEVNLWISILFSVIGALCATFASAVGIAIVWGRYSQQLEDLTAKQKTTNGDLKEQVAKDQSLDTRVVQIETRCGERGLILDRNDRDHAEIFSRLIQLETGYAAIPGQMTRIIDSRFIQWRKTMKIDIRTILYEIQQEYNRRERRPSQHWYQEELEDEDEGSSDEQENDQ